MNVPLGGNWTWDYRNKVLKRNGITIRRSYFDPRPSGIHRAVDIPASRGTILRAIDEGRIRRIGNEGTHGFGKYLMLECSFPGKQGPHDVVYAHLLSYLASEGNRVDEDEGIAKVDSTGNSTGDHVHNEIWWNIQDRASSIDPYWLWVWQVEQNLGASVHRMPYPTPSEKSVTDRVIQFGEYGNRVLWLQWCLKFWRIHGHYGEGTEDRVRAFQQKHGIKVTGKVGPVTRKALVATSLKRVS